MEFTLPPTGFKRLFYDIETSPNIGFFWGSGYRISIPPENIIKERAIICICWKWEGQEKVHSATWDNGCDKLVLEAFMNDALKADELVAHNGDNFDEKWVRTQCLKFGIPCPPKLNSLDTLKKVRRHFRFNSNKLDYLGKLFFNTGKSPIGWDDWVQICMHNDLDALEKMVIYCKKDVVLLEDVFHKIQPYIDSNTHAGAQEGFGRYSCPSCGNDAPKHHSIRYTKAGMPRHRMICSDTKCGKYFTISHKVWQDKLEADYLEANAKK